MAVTPTWKILGRTLFAASSALSPSKRLLSPPLRMASTSTDSHTNVIGKLHPSSTTLLICDVQERFMPLIHHAPSVVSTCRYLTNVARLLDLPMVVTQQYTPAFGPTVPDCFAPLLDSDPSVVDPLAGIPVFEKKLFSMMTPEVQAHVDALETRAESFLIVGIEAHVCVQQTCLDLRAQNKAVHLIVDGVSSQSVLDRTVALHRLAAAGVHLTTAQSAVFMLMQSADHAHFKAISKLTVQHMKIPNGFHQDATAASAAGSI